jgi:tetratricopeptide (TPR) repeat protein
MPGKKQKLLQKADAFARDKKLKKAISLYKQVIEEDAADIRTRLRLSELLYQAGRFPEALEVLQFVGDYYREHGFLLKSVAVYKKMLEVDPARSELHGTLAQLYFQLGMAPDAIRQFKAHIRALLKQGKMVDSLFVVRSMLELDPANVTDRLRLAENFSHHELIDEAATEYRRVLSLLEKGGQDGEWCSVAMRYLHHNPEDDTIRRRVVEHLLREGDYYRALQHLHACLEKDPRDTQLLDMGANCFEMLGQPEKAIVALKSMVSIYRQKGLSDEEQNAFVRILQLDPKDEQALRALGVEDSEPEVDAEMVELEWAMPEGATDEPPPPPPTEFAETIYEPEPPSFADEWAEEATMVEPLSPDLLKELMLDGGDEEEGTLAVDVLRLKRAIDAREPMTPAELEEAGVTMSANDREELEFFLSSGLKDEALAILAELHSRLS